MLRCMPALKPVHGVLKIKFFQRVGSDTDISSHLYFQTFTPANLDQIIAVTDVAHASYVTHCIPLLNFNSSLEQVEGVELSSPDGPLAINPVPVQGIRAQGELPANACALFNIPVARRYRGGKPRVYWPFGSEPDIATPQTWSTTFITAANTGVNALISEVTANLGTWAPGSALCSVSYFSGSQWKPDHLGNYHQIPTPRDVPLVDVVKGAPGFNTVIGSQRTRLRPN